MPTDSSATVPRRSRVLHSCFAGSACALRVLIVSLLIVGSDSRADIISLDTNVWDHGGGGQVGWLDGQLSGTTNFGAASVTITSSVLGTAVATANHMTRINQSFFSGFAFQMDPGTTSPTGPGGNPTGILRLDFAFSQPVNIDSFTLTDVDRSNTQWWDVVVAEGFVNGLGAVGSGRSANYMFNTPTNEQVVNYNGLLAARPRSNTGNVQNTPVADVSFDFSTPVTAFSIYYFNNNRTDNGSSTQTIGLRGNQFEVTAVPEAPPMLMALVALVLFGVIARVKNSTLAIPFAGRP